MESHQLITTNARMTRKRRRRRASETAVRIKRNVKVSRNESEELPRHPVALTTLIHQADLKMAIKRTTAKMETRKTLFVCRCEIFWLKMESQVRTMRKLENG